MVAFTYSLIYHSDRFGYKPLRIPSACERFQVEKTVSMDGDDLATLGASAFLPLPALAVFYPTAWASEDALSEQRRDGDSAITRAAMRHN